MSNTAIKKINTLLALAAEIEQSDAKEAGTLAYLNRIMTQITLPHSKVKGDSFVRNNGITTVTIQALPNCEVPYGSAARLIMAWLITEAVQNKSRDISLGRSMSEFMRKLGYVAGSCGKKGQMTLLRKQAIALFSCRISAVEINDRKTQIKNMTVATKATLWWDTRHPNLDTLWSSSVRLHEEFYDQCVSRPIPVDMRILRSLTRSPLEMDVYAWLTYKTFCQTRSGKSSTPIPWAALQAQFGANYNSVRHFKHKFIKALHHTQLLIPGTAFQERKGGLVIHPKLTTQ
ncbi:MAG: pirin [Flavobacteriaceae bacterium]|nr:MAG: pirin [Flavobacteriaceae bacterium]